MDMNDEKNPQVGTLSCYLRVIPLSTRTACKSLFSKLVVRTDMEVSIARNIIVNIIAAILHIET